MLITAKRLLPDNLVIKDQKKKENKKNKESDGQNNPSAV